MSIEKLKEQVSTAIAIDQPLMIWGPPGAGKTQAIEQYCRENNYGFIDIRLSQMDAVDLRGIPFSKKDDHGIDRTFWAYPVIWPTEDKPCIIFFDEINHGTQATLSAAFQVIQERRLGELVFPEQVRVLAAGNRATDRTFANQMPSALRNRFSHTTVMPTEEDFCKYASSANFAPAVIGFIRFSPTSLNEFAEHSNTEEDKKRLSKIKTNLAIATPRTWEVVSKLIKHRTITSKDGTERIELDAIREFILGTVGETVGTRFLGYIEYVKDLPDLNELLKNPKKFTIPNSAQARYAICAGLAPKANDENIENLISYLLRMDPEFQAMCVKDAIARDPMLMTCQSVLDWAEHNKGVLF